MFNSAKFKLTAWYLAIIMAITLSFSTIVYLGVAHTTQRALEAQRVRFERQVTNFGQFPKPVKMFAHIDVEALKEIRSRTFWTLAWVNAVIFAGAGSLGYFLAGKTLKPIEQMLEKQKRFISDAAHEIKTPLTAIKTDLEVTLRDKNLTLDKSKKALQSSIEETDKLHLLTQKLLNQSKYQQTKHLNGDVIKIDEAVRNVINKLNKTAKQKVIALDVETKEFTVKGNLESLEEALTNIIENAIKYSEKGSKVLINVSKEKDQVAIKVSDNGIGISRTELPYIFDPFYRGDISRTKSRENGHGLGLTIAKEIIENHKGTINTQSTEGIGTTFTIKLPLSQQSLRNSN